MSSRAGNWIIAVGAVMAFLGLCTLPAALSERGDGTLLSVSACLFSVGALIIATGIYLKARFLQSVSETKIAAAAAAAAAIPPRRLRGGCDLCGTEAPIIQCKTHQLHLCGTCLAAHYDQRSCSYVPTTRRPATKTSKGAAKARGA